MPTNKDRPKSLADHTATAAAVARENLIQDQYSSWSRTALLNRVRELEDAAKNEGKVVPEAKNPYYFDPIYSPTPFAAESSTSSGGNTSTLANQSFNNNQRQQRGQGSGSKALTVIAINNGTATSSTASPITTSGPGSEVGGESSAVESPRIYTTIETPKKKERRPFDFSKYAKRHIAFKIAYFGWDYNGFAAQGSNVDLKTIEAQIFNAFVAARFIEDPDECNYSRCGRTDRGVSGLGQVIALTVRSSLPKDSPFVLREEGDGYVEPEATTDGHERTQEETMEEYEKRAGVFIKKGIKRHKDGSVYGELPYLNVINRLLPPDIRVVAWAPVAPTFDARFDCKWRQYKYFFPKGQIDIEKMKVAANKFLGTHDFRNFCKFDSSKSYVNYERTIHAISIDPIEDHTFAGSTRLDGTKVVGFGDSSRQFYEMTLTGSAFLWHQVRCMMSVLLTVGQGLESVDIVDELMDLTKYPAKPNYDMAADLPLVLYDCHFENLEWQYQTETDLVHDITPLRLYRGMEDAWSCHVIKSLMYSRLVLALDNAVLMNLPKKGDRTLLGPYAVENVANEKNISLGADLRMFMGKRYASMSDRKKCLPTDEKTKRHNERKRQRLALLTASEENSPSPSQGGEDTPMAEPDSPSTPTAEASSSSATTEVQQRTEAVVVPAKQA